MPVRSPGSSESKEVPSSGPRLRSPAVKKVPVPAPAPVSNQRSVLVEVVDASTAPRAGVHVLIAELSQSRTMRLPVSSWTDERGVTDARGHVRVELDASTHVVGVYDPNDSASATAVCEGETCRFILPRRQPLRILVVSPRGDPVSGARVWLEQRTPEGAWLTRHDVTNADGCVDARLPEGTGRARAIHEDIGIADKAILVGTSSLTLVLQGDCETGFRVTGDLPAEELIGVWYVVRWMNWVCWADAVQVHPGEFVSVGRLPSRFHVTVLAFASDGRTAHESWAPKGNPLQEIELGPGTMLSVDVASSGALPSPMTVWLIPPLPYRKFLGAFPEIKDRFRLPLSGRAAVQFVGLPRLIESEPWRIAASMADHSPLACEPDWFTLDGATEDPEGANRVTLHVEDSRCTPIEGRIRDAIDGSPVPFARIARRFPEPASVSALSDVSGEFRIVSTRPLPVQLFVMADGYVPQPVTVNRGPDQSGSVRAVVRLVPLDEHRDHSVTVRVRGPDGKPVGRALLQWRMKGRGPIGRVISSSERPPPVTLIPGGAAALSVTPPLQSGLQAHEEEYAIDGDRVIDVALEPKIERGDLRLVFDGAVDPSRLSWVKLVGPQEQTQHVEGWAVVFQGLPFGSYDVTAGTVEGVELRLERVHVEEQRGAVYLTLDALGSAAVRIEKLAGVDSCTAYLKDARDDRVIGTKKTKPGSSVQWFLPRGSYTVDVFGGGRCGSARLEVPQPPSPGIRVALAAEAGSAELRFLVPGTDVVLVDVTVEGPIVRRWHTSLHVNEGVAIFQALGLLPGTYEITARAGTGAPRMLRLDIVPGKVLHPEPVTLPIENEH